MNQRKIARDIRRTATPETLQYIQSLIAYKRTHIQREQERLDNLVSIHAPRVRGDRRKCNHFLPHNRLFLDCACVFYQIHIQFATINRLSKIKIAAPPREPSSNSLCI